MGTSISISISISISMPHGISICRHAVMTLQTWSIGSCAPVSQTPLQSRAVCFSLPSRPKRAGRNVRPNSKQMVGYPVDVDTSDAACRARSGGEAVRTGRLRGGSDYIPWPGCWPRLQYGGLQPQHYQVGGSAAEHVGRTHCLSGGAPSGEVVCSERWRDPRWAVPPLVEKHCGPPTRDQSRGRSRWADR
eukprot:1412107-Prymnesium_polylepis.1